MLNYRKPKVKKGALIFVLCMLIYPLVQWLIFYVYANINSILLSFQRYNISTGQFEFLPFSSLFSNFGAFFKDLFTGKNLPRYFLNGAILHAAGLLISFPVGIIFAYIVYKKLPLSGYFKVMLYLPTILSSMVIIMLFKYFIEKALPGFFKIFGVEDFPLLLTTPEYNFQTILAYSVIMAMPGNIVITVSTMSRIPAELTEYGNLEGISMFQEFRYLVIPMIFPILEVYLLGMFVGFFTAQGPLYAMFAENAADNVVTFGYYMFTRVVGRNSSEAMYGYTAAANLSIGLVSVPIVYLTKFVLDRLDPGAEF